MGKGNNSNKEEAISLSEVSCAFSERDNILDEKVQPNQEVEEVKDIFIYIVPFNIEKSSFFCCRSISKHHFQSNSVSTVQCKTYCNCHLSIQTNCK